MKLKIEIDLENDAFLGVNGEYEMGRILINLGEEIKTAGLNDDSDNVERRTIKKLFDMNGNSVGTVKLED